MDPLLVVRRVGCDRRVAADIRRVLEVEVDAAAVGLIAPVEVRLPDPRRRDVVWLTRLRRRREVVPFAGGARDDTLAATVRIGAGLPGAAVGAFDIHQDAD